MRSIAVRAPDTTMTSERLRRWTGPIILLLAGTGLATWKLPLFPDAMVDFGREVYVPWRITEGEAIYRDIEYFNGPLSPYLHALVFSLFGVSIMTLKVFNLGIVALVTALLYRLLLEISDRFAATVACLMFPALYAFGHLTYYANFNWITPYSYELPHGVALSLGMIASLWWYGRSRKRLYVALGGVLFGLVLLTKAEVQLAAGLAVVGWVICLPLQRHARGESVRAVLMFAGCAVAPVVVAALMLRLAMPMRDVLHGLAGSWKWVGHEELGQLYYFRFLMGTHDTRGSVLAMAAWTGWYAVLLAAMTAAGVGVQRLRLAHGQREMAAVACGLVAAGIFYAVKNDPWFWAQHAKPLPLFMMVAGLVLLWRVRRHWHDRAMLAQLSLPLMLVIFAGALLGKMLLNVRPLHYGFALAMPAATLLAAWLVGWVPRRLSTSMPAAAAPARAIALAACAVTMLMLSRIEAPMMAQKTVLIGDGGDAYLADPERAHVINAALADLQRLPTPNQTMIVMPEGLTIGYLARRVNPSGHLNFAPPALIMFSEERMLADLQRSPPDLILLTHFDTSDYGTPFFGRDYAQQIGLWISREYTIAARHGALPFTSERFGILILRRNGMVPPPPRETPQ